MSTALTVEKYERTIARLRGRRIRKVAYHPLTVGDDGHDVEDWDFGAWHQPTMGVELSTDDGARYSAVWGSSFDHYGLEVFPEPMTAHLVMNGSAMVDVTEHPGWSPLVGKKLTRTEIVWSGNHVRVPYAIRLCSRDTVVWIAAGRPADRPEGGFYLGTDDVMVVLTVESAEEVGIPVS
ncbi:hypothetical protein [Herbidospora daliensis]|uniref:hypothetical protein n=1 Tax=Herbidospora daliensis TaxID=295585 RepID=UPI0007835A55|nr:hypothetical protein [Herbidospora daliensis]